MANYYSSGTGRLSAPYSHSVQHTSFASDINCVDSRGKYPISITVEATSAGNLVFEQEDGTSITFGFAATSFPILIPYGPKTIKSTSTVSRVTLNYY